MIQNLELTIQNGLHINFFRIQFNRNMDANVTEFFQQFKGESSRHTMIIQRKNMYSITFTSALIWSKIVQSLANISRPFSYIEKNRYASLEF